MTINAAILGQVVILILLFTTATLAVMRSKGFDISKTQIVVNLFLSFFQPIGLIFFAYLVATKKKLAAPA